MAFFIFILVVFGALASCEISFLPRAFATCTDGVTPAVTGVRLPGAPFGNVTRTSTPKVIFAATNAGFIHTLYLSGEATNGYTLTSIARNDGCKSNPTWLSFDSARDQLWCLDEGTATALGTLNTFNIDRNNSLHRFQRVPNLGVAPVHQTFFNNGSGLAVAMYGGGVRFLQVANNGLVTGSQSQNFTTGVPRGPPQDISRLHGFALDPSGQYLIALDFGADLIRIFYVNGTSVSVNSAVPLLPISGPRHAVFWSPGRSTDVFLHVLGELSNKITTLKVTYGNNTMGLTHIGETLNYGGLAPSTTPKAAEILVSVGIASCLHTRTNNFVA